MINNVPQIVTQVNENTYPVSTTIDAPFVEVTSVNGMTGDVIVNIILDDFIPNHFYKRGSAVIHNQGLYYAKVDFTSGATFNQADWDVPSFVQEQADWNESDSTKNSYIKNKPSLATVATSGSYADLSNRPTRTSDFINDGSDNTSTYVENDELANVATSGAYSDLSGTPNLATVATSGSYNDLSDTPTISALLDVFYPVGSYYETSDSTFDPNVSWGGTWVEDTKGRATVSKADSGTFATLGDTGGTETVTIAATNLPTHTHTYDKSAAATAGHQLTANQLPKITGSFTLAALYKSNMILAYNSGVFTGAKTGDGVADNWTASGSVKTHNDSVVMSFGNNQTHAHNITLTSTNSGDGGFSNTAMTNLQPYVVVKRWHRTA